MNKQIVLKPRMSEKTYGLSLARNLFVFEVPAGASKQTVAAAVTAQFGVAVVNVNMMNVKGKAKRTIRKGGRPTMGKRSDIKKAYVTLKQGDSLPFFATEEDKDAKKKDKKADKTEKTEKPAKAKKSLFGKRKAEKEKD